MQNKFSPITLTQSIRPPNQYKQLRSHNHQPTTNSQTKPQQFSKQTLLHITPRHINNTRDTIIITNNLTIPAKKRHRLLVRTPSRLRHAIKRQTNNVNISRIQLRLYNSHHTTQIARHTHQPRRHIYSHANLITNLKISTAKPLPLLSSHHRNNDTLTITIPNPISRTPRHITHRFLNTRSNRPEVLQA